MTTSTCTHTATIARNNVTEASAKLLQRLREPWCLSPSHGTERERSSLNVLESSRGQQVKLIRSVDIVNGKRTSSPSAALRPRRATAPMAG